MRQFRHIILSLSLMPLLACASVKVNANYDVAVDFSRYRSYGWGAGPVSLPELEEQIHSAADATLLTAGYQRMPTDSADMLLSYIADLELAFDSRREPHVFSTEGAPIQHRPLPLKALSHWEGTLKLMFVDRESGLWLWTGVAEGQFGTAEELQRAIAKIMEGFPPQR